MILRKCNKCGLEATSMEELDLFVKGVVGQDKYERRNMCKECRKSNRTDGYKYEASLKYYLKNKDKIDSYRAEYRKANREKTVEYNKIYCQENKDKKRQGAMKYISSKMQRTPKWLTEDDFWVMEQAYITAEERTKKYGVKFHVDHIIPLQGVDVCGLHVPWNLQILPILSNKRR